MTQKMSRKEMKINKKEDMLIELFKKQILLQQKLKNLPFKNKKHQQEFINLNFLACLDELSEALRETAWKNPKLISCGWKQGQELNKNLFQEELIDLWHFLINLSIASGMTAEDIFIKFCKKNEINHKRQEDGY